MTPPALELRDIRKRFGNVVALDGADFLLRRGTVHTLLGENGAGKTRLMRIAFGLTPTDAGTSSADGATRRLRSPADAIRAGIGMVQQHFTLVPALTTLENISLGWRAVQHLRDEALRLDVAAMEHVQRRLREAAGEGTAVIYYTEDLDELLDIAHRVLVVFDGRVREVSRDRDTVGRAMPGAA